MRAGSSGHAITRANGWPTSAACPTSPWAPRRPALVVSDRAAGRTDPARHVKLLVRHVERHAAGLADERHHPVGLGRPGDDHGHARSGIRHEGSSRVLSAPMVGSAFASIARIAFVAAPTPSRYEIGFAKRNERAMRSSSTSSSISTVDPTHASRSKVGGSDLLGRVPHERVGGMFPQRGKRRSTHELYGHGGWKAMHFRIMKRSTVLHK